MKKFMLGFVLAAVLFSVFPVSASIQQYLLTPSTAKITVDGSVLNDTKLPILIYKGYNYAPVSTFKNICDKIGIGFKWDGAKSEIQLNTKTAGEPAKEGNVVNEKAPLNKYGLPDFSKYDGERPKIEDDGKNQYFTYEGVKYIRLGWDSRHPPMWDRPFYLANLEKDENGYIILRLCSVDPSNSAKFPITINEIPFALYGVHTYYVPHDYYLNTFLPSMK